MQDSPGPTLENTLSFIRKAGQAENKGMAKLHLENLLYMKSMLYLDEKNNEKHLARVNSLLASFKNVYKKEITEADQSGGNIYLVAQILAANKIIDNAIMRLKGFIDRVGPVEMQQSEKEVVTPAAQTAITDAKEKSSLEVAANFSSEEVTETPKLRETMAFLLSIIGDPLRVTNKIPSHLGNLEKISKLIKRKYQDPKIQKLNESIMAILGKIYGTNNEKEISHLLDNSIKILKNIAQYKLLIVEFETTVKGFIVVPSKSEGAADTPYFLRQPRDQADKFYKTFKEEKNVIKKIGMLETVLSSPVYKYNKELNAASLKALRGFEKMGLQLEVALPSPEKK